MLELTIFVSVFKATRMKIVGLWLKTVVKILKCTCAFARCNLLSKLTSFFLFTSKYRVFDLNYNRDMSVPSVNCPYISLYTEIMLGKRVLTFRAM